MSFTDIFIRRPVLALVVSLLILLIGLKAMTGLQIRQYPKLSNTTITVTTLYPGASPDLMQGFITTPISQAVSTAEGIDYLTASSIQGTSTVTAYIRLNYDPSQALTDIMAKVQQVKFQLPKESQDPVIIKSTGQTTAVMYIGFASPELSSAAISDYLTRVVQPLLATVDGVASADILGGQTFAMRLWLDPARMAARGISASDVAAAIRANNFQSAPGQTKGNFTITNDNAETEFRQASLDSVKPTRAAEVVSVIGVIFLFLASVRAVLFPVVTIPLSLVGAGIIMAALGFSLNLLTLLALVLAIGLVVDDAIVVLENVYRHIEAGRTPAQAALIGAREIAGPVISMTLTLAAVYTPIGFLGGVTGALFREFAFTLAGAVIISGVVAVTLSPMMCSLLLSRQMLHGRFVHLIDRVFSRLAEWYGRKLERSLDYRPVTALFAAAVFASLVFIYMNTKSELAPEEDQGVLFALTKAPQYSNLDYTDAYGAELDKAFTSIPEADLRFVVNGRFGPNQGIAGVILKPWNERGRSAQEIKPVLQGLVGKVEGLQAFAFSLPPLPASIGGLPVQMVVSSTGEFPSIYQAMEKIKAAARQSGLFIVVDSDLAFNQPTI